MYKIGDEVLLEGRVWVITEFGTDDNGLLCVTLEWRDVPEFMQKHYEVPARMIVRDISCLKVMARAA